MPGPAYFSYQCYYLSIMMSQFPTTKRAKKESLSLWLAIMLDLGKEFLHYLLVNCVNCFAWQVYSAAKESSPTAATNHVLTGYYSTYLLEWWQIRHDVATLLYNSSNRHHLHAPMKKRFVTLVISYQWHQGNHDNDPKLTTSSPGRMVSQAQ